MNEKISNSVSSVMEKDNKDMLEMMKTFLTLAPKFKKLGKEFGIWSGEAGRVTSCRRIHG